MYWDGIHYKKIQYIIMQSFPTSLNNRKIWLVYNDFIRVDLHICKMLKKM